MLKFFRKYNKFLLAGFGTILLVTWLVPSAITEFAQSSGAQSATWATVGNGENLTVAQLQRLQRQLKVVNALGSSMLQQLGGENDPALWYLLVREARQAGLIGGISDGHRLLAAMPGGAKPELVLPRLSAESGLQPTAVLETLAELQGVARLLSVAANAARLSDARLEVKAAEAMTGVAADVVLISAANPLPANEPVPTPTQMQSLLADFAAKEPGTGRGGIGYRQPAKFSMEWFVVRPSDVRASLSNDPALSGVALRKAFLKNPTAYGVVAGDTTADFEPYREKVLEKELNRLTTERLDEMVKFIGDQTQLGLRGFPKDGVYAKIPADFNGVGNLAGMAGSLATQFKIAPPTVEMTGSITNKDLSGVPGLGSASTTRFGTQPMQTGDLVMQAREFTPEQVRAVLQAGIIGPPLRSRTVGDVPAELYAFRILEAVPSHNAANAEEIGSQLIEDAARFMRYEILERDRAAIETQAKADLASTAKTYGSTVEFAPAIREADASLLKYGMKIPTSIPGVGSDADIAKNIVQRAMALPADLGSVSDADRTFVLVAPEKLSLVAVKIREVFPVSREDFTDAASNQRFIASILDDGQAKEFAKTFSADALKSRHGFKPSRDETAEDEPAAATTDASKSNS